MALMALATLSCPAAALCRLVYTALLNAGYHGGAPAGKMAREWSFAKVASSAAPGTLPEETRRARPELLAGSGKPLTDPAAPLAPAKAAWLVDSSYHLMNSTAALTFFAVTGMPIPSGLPRLGAGPLVPGVGMYSICPTTFEEL